ncbi:MAG TPA: D-alanine--D-alanine ligase [Candidatus Limnocylindria bacterium]|nr:D-alanine--D-alanine ligase [Candidatus Limnocylindria bacterium]
MKERLRVGVLTGGASAERDISLATGAQIAASLPREKYDVVLLDPLALMTRNPSLTAEQRALAERLQEGGGRLEALPTYEALPRGLEGQIEAATRALVPATRAIGAGAEPLDVVIVALHGPWGEDGRIQGMLDILGVPYTGSGHAASAVAMDKVLAKKLLAAEGLDVPRGVVVARADDPAARTIPPPLFVKPVQQGSSIGSHVVARHEDLEAAISDALRYDERVLVEERVGGRELTVAVIGNDDLQALPVIEIVTKRPFFDYRAKYDAGESEEIVPADVPADVAARVQGIALAAHRALGCRGMSRTDVIWSPDTGRMAALEVNTIPGMTANSLLPKAAKAAGIGFGELLEKLVGWALEDARRRSR